MMAHVFIKLSGAAIRTHTLRMTSWEKIFCISQRTANSASAMVAMGATLERALK